MVELVAAGLLVYALSPGDGKMTKSPVVVMDVSQRSAKQVEISASKGTGPGVDVGGMSWAERMVVERGISCGCSR